MLLLRAGPLRRATPTGPSRPHGPSRSTTDPGWWPTTNGRSDATSRSCAWITTSRSSRPNPAALPGATALAQAKARGVFTASHQAYWDAARAARGDAGGTRALIAILLAHRTMPAAALHRRDGPGRRLGVPGSRDRAHRRPPRHQPRWHPSSAIGALARYDRPPPSLTDYDDLLTGSES